MNSVMSALYGEGFFIHWAKAEKIAKLWLLFLQKYAMCARLVYRHGRSRFALVPKLHMLPPWMHEAAQASRACKTEWNSLDCEPLGGISPTTRRFHRQTVAIKQAGFCEADTCQGLQTVTNFHYAVFERSRWGQERLIFLRNVRWNGNKRLPAANVGNNWAWPVGWAQ